MSMGVRMNTEIEMYTALMKSFNYVDDVMEENIYSHNEFRLSKLLYLETSSNLSARKF